MSIQGVIIKKLKKHKDNRGWLTEIYRKDTDEFKPKMSYVSYTKYGQKRGPHEHKKQSDYFVFLGYGDFELYLWDNREDSKKKMKLIVGESNKVSVIVPPGVVHGYKSISKQGSLCINLPDELYKKNGDEIRHEDNKQSRFKIK